METLDRVQVAAGVPRWVFVGWGVLLWAVATLIFRWAGPWLLAPGVPTLLTYVGAVPLIAAVTLPLYAWARVAREQRLAAAVLIALPGMLLDMVGLHVGAWLFPTLPPAAGPSLAGWLLWAYALILCSGVASMLVPRRDRPHRVLCKKMA